MAKFFIGIFIGLVVATSSPKVAGLARDLFNAGRDLGSEVVETVSEATSK